jgi:hypothetical protein
MCSIDWGLLSNVITATATAALAVGGFFTAKYAFQAAKAANQTLRLEQEPILMLSAIDFDKIADVMQDARSYRITSNDGRLQLHLEPMLAEEVGVSFFAIENLGRSPALNVKVTLVLTSNAAMTGGRNVEPLPAACFFQSLLPKERVFIALPNDTFSVVNVGAGETQRATVASAGILEKGPLFANDAFPLPIVPSDHAK